MRKRVENGECKKVETDQNLKFLRNVLKRIIFPFIDQFLVVRILYIDVLLEITHLNAEWICF